MVTLSMCEDNGHRSKPTPPGSRRNRSARPGSTLAAYHEGVHLSELQATRGSLLDADVGADPEPDRVLSPARR